MTTNNQNEMHVGNMSIVEHHRSQIHISTQSMLVPLHRHAAKQALSFDCRWSPASEKELSSSPLIFHFSWS